MYSKTRSMVVVGMLGALTVVMGLTGIGFIPIPPVRATIMHLPVILAGILEGPAAGAAVGAIFGGFSMYQAATIGTPISKALFLNPLIAFGPRILIGIVAAYGFKLAQTKWSRIVTALLLLGLTVSLAYTSWTGLESGKVSGSVFGFMLFGVAAAAVSVLYLLWRGNQAGPGFAAMLGTLTNTIGVLGLGVVFQALPAPLALTIGITNSPAEIFAATTVTILVYEGVSRALGHRRSNVTPTPTAI